VRGAAVAVESETEAGAAAGLAIGVDRGAAGQGLDGEIGAPEARQTVFRVVLAGDCTGRRSL
jgi:hypothetical protein